MPHRRAGGDEGAANAVGGRLAAEEVGSNPSDPVGSFPHIPYYALGCTLEAIAAESNGRMTVEAIGRSAQGRPLYAATINALDAQSQQKGFERWQKLRRFALNHPADAQAQLAEWGDAFKIPIYIQAGIHGNEYEGVDATMLLLNRLATTPYGTDPFVDRALDYVILVVNIDQNPDGRALGQRANGDRYALTVGSPTAVRVLNELVGDGVATQLALASFTSGGNTYPAGSAIFQADAATQAALNAAGSANGILFHPVSSGALPALDPIDRVPRIAVLTAVVNQDLGAAEPRLHRRPDRDRDDESA
jgi:Zinc carboxypeptidase